MNKAIIGFSLTILVLIFLLSVLELFENKKIDCLKSVANNICETYGGRLHTTSIHLFYCIINREAKEFHFTDEELKSCDVE